MTDEPAEPAAEPAATPTPEPEERVQVDAEVDTTAVISSALDPVIAKLRRPPAPEAVRFKIQTNPKSPDKNALIVTYIDARFCADRLNIVAPGMWSDKLAAVPWIPGEQASAVSIVKLRIPLPDGTELVVQHEDVGTSKGLKEDIDVKALASDAFKRTCVKFGIGACIYAAPKQYIKGRDLDSYEGRGGTKYTLSSANERKLRNEYAKWVSSPEVEQVFGKPLSHGDANDGQGDIDAELETERAAPVPAGPPFGPPAGDKLTSQLGGAMGYLLDNDIERAGALHAKLLERCGGYMPEIVARAVALAAGAVKTMDDEVDAQRAAAELDAAADVAAGGEDPAPAPEAAPEPAPAEPATTTEGATT
jgi:hypothetical protein